VLLSPGRSEKGLRFNRYQANRAAKISRRMTIRVILRLRLPFFVGSPAGAPSPTI